MFLAQPSSAPLSRASEIRRHRYWTRLYVDEQSRTLPKQTFSFFESQHFYCDGLRISAVFARCARSADTSHNIVTGPTCEILTRTGRRVLEPSRARARTHDNACTRIAAGSSVLSRVRVRPGDRAGLPESRCGYRVPYTMRGRCRARVIHTRAVRAKSDDGRGGAVWGKAGERPRSADVVDDVFTMKNNAVNRGRPRIVRF